MNNLIDQITKDKILQRRELLRKHAPIIYQLFAAKKLYERNKKG